VGVAETEHTALRGDDPVAVPVGGGRHAYGGCPEVFSGHRPVRVRITCTEHGAVFQDEPVTLSPRHRGHPTAGELGSAA